MPRARRTSNEPTFDPIQEELDDARKRLGDPFEGMSPAERKVAERRWDRRQAKWQRRIDKAVAKWERMTILERKAWSDEYLRPKRRGAQSKPAPAAAELPLLYAVITIAERDRAKAAKSREVEKAAEVDPYAAHRKATGEEPRAPRATSPSAAPEAPPAAPTGSPKPERPRRRRRGRPAVGPIGSQAGGVWYPPIYDEDDFE